MTLLRNNRVVSVVSELGQTGFKPEAADSVSARQSFYKCSTGYAEFGLGPATGKPHCN
jgi:hypothetical protein